MLVGYRPKKYTYINIKSTTAYILSSELGLPLPQASESQFRRLEKKLSLSTLWLGPSASIFFNFSEKSLVFYRATDQLTQLSSTVFVSYTYVHGFFRQNLPASAMKIRVKRFVPQNCVDSKGYADDEFFLIRQRLSYGGNLIF
jgi:hypothetical protein